VSKVRASASACASASAALACAAIALAASGRSAGQEALRPAEQRSPSEQRSPAERRSIEELVAEIRARREQAQEALRPAVEALWSRLLALPKPPPAAALAAEHAALVALGTEAVPLYAARLDPPADQGAHGEAARLAARQVAAAIAAMDADAALAELLELADRGSPEGRRNAARALGASRTPELVVPVLDAMLRAADAALRREAIESLARLGPAGAASIERALSDASSDLVRSALVALAEARAAAAAPAVGRVLAGGSAVACTGELVAYYAAVPEAFTREVLAGLLRLACSPALEPAERALVLEHAATADVSWESSLRGELDALVDGSDFAARVDALVCLARLGDSRSKRDLERDMDEIVAKQERWPPAYVQRADVEVRLGELEAALKDYRRALELEAGDERSGRDMSAAYVGEARVLCLQTKLKEASEALRRSPLNEKQLRALASQRDFAALASHPKFGAVIGGPPDPALPAD
jgi:hypothetical protein